MIRLITCIKRKKDISSKKFRDYWNDPQFAILFDRIVSLLRPYRLSRKLTLQVGANIRIMQAKKTKEPYDAVIEWWFEKRKPFSAAPRKARSARSTQRNDEIPRPVCRF